MGDRQEKIRERAYEIWLKEGQPEGRDAEHWKTAANELGFDDAPPVEKAPPEPATGKVGSLGSDPAGL